MKRPTLFLILVLAGFRLGGAEDARPVAPPAPVRVEPPSARAEVDSVAEPELLQREFLEARREYLRKRAEWQKDSRGLTEEQRQALRDRLRSLYEEQVRAREELRGRLRALRENLPRHQELLDQAREKTRDHGRRTE